MTLCTPDCDIDYCGCGEEMCLDHHADFVTCGNPRVIHCSDQCSRTCRDCDDMRREDALIERADARRKGDHQA